MLTGVSDLIIKRTTAPRNNQILNTKIDIFSYYYPGIKFDYLLFTVFLCSMLQPHNSKHDFDAHNKSFIA